jgi:hypothetical protein
MDRLTEKLALAASVVSTQTTLLENDADALIARGAEFSRRRSATFAAQHAVLDQGTKGMDALDSKLSLLSNDPMKSSGDSQTGTVVNSDGSLHDIQGKGLIQLERIPELPPTEPPPNVNAQSAPFQPMHQTTARAVPSRRDL